MNKKATKNLIGAAIWLIVFGIFTYLVKTVDVRAIGPDGTKVGFAGMNGLFNGWFGFEKNILGVSGEKLYDFAQIGGYITLTTAALMALLFVYTFFRLKGIKAENKTLFCLMLLYTLAVICYVLFFKFPINYRPAVVDPAEWPEWSYPSSHTIMTLCVYTTIGTGLRSWFKNRKFIGVVEVIGWIVMVAAVVLRAICGIHWLTDIFGAIAFGNALICLFDFMCSLGKAPAEATEPVPAALAENKTEGGEEAIG